MYTYIDIKSKMKQKKIPMENFKTYRQPHMDYKELTEKEILDFKNTILDRIPEDFSYYKQYIKFVQHKPPKKHKTSFPLIPVATKPMEFIYNNDVYRIIPRYPAYAITNYGKLINYYTKTPITVREANDYLRVSIYDHYFRISIVTNIHRLVALAWVPNDDWLNKNVVDHIDEDKKNNNASNLRWVTYRENTVKSVNKHERRWVMLNVVTNKIKEFRSLTEVSEFTGVGKSALQSNKCPMLLKDKKGEEWILDDKENFSNFGATKQISGLGNKRYYHLLVDGKLVKVYNGILDILKDHGKSGRLSFEDTVEYIKKWYLRQGKKAVLKEIKNKKEPSCYQALNLITKEIVEDKTISGLARKIGLDRRMVYYRFNIRYGQPLNNWIFKTCEDKKFPISVKAKNKHMTVIAENEKETHTFSSLREASRFFNVDRKTLKNKAKNGIKLNGYLIKIISE